MSTSLTTRFTRPVVLVTGPSRYCRVSAWWTPSWTSGVPRSSFHVPGLTGEVSEKFASARTTVPSAPLSTTAFALRAAPRRRSSWPTRSTTPAAAQASRIRSPAAIVVAIGFSTKTCFPRSAAVTVCSSWPSFGVALDRPSGRRVGAAPPVLDARAVDERRPVVGAVAVDQVVVDRVAGFADHRCSADHAAFGRARAEHGRDPVVGLLRDVEQPLP